MNARFEDALSEQDRAYDARPRSALEGAEAATASAANGSPHIEDLGLVGVTLVRADLSRPSIAETLARALETGSSPVSSDAAGPALPTPGLAVLGAKGATLRVDANEVLAVSDYDAAPEIADSVKKAFSGASPVAILCEAVSDGFAHFRLRGPGAREALATASSLDAHPRAFGPGDVRRARLGLVETVLFIRPTERPGNGPDDHGIELLAPRSLASALYRRLSRSSGVDRVFGSVPTRRDASHAT